MGGLPETWVANRERGLIERWVAKGDGQVAKRLMAG
jgi:hypothetical protein